MLGVYSWGILRLQIMGVYSLWILRFHKPEQFHHPQCSLMLPFHSRLLPASLTPGNRWAVLHTYSLAFLRMSLPCNHIICSIGGSFLPFSTMLLRFIQNAGYISSFFISSIICSFGMDVPMFIYSFRSWWSFVLWIQML